MGTFRDLSGTWEFHLDGEKIGMEIGLANRALGDSIKLPATVASACKGHAREVEEIGFLTDPWFFEGWTWFSRVVDLPEMGDQEICLVMERTRTSHVWVDGNYAGGDNSLCSSHRLRLTSLLKPGRQRLTIMVDNTACPVKGGHMTSPDTQTNWNGITGRIGLEIKACMRIEAVRIQPQAAERRISLGAVLSGDRPAWVEILVRADDGREIMASQREFQPGENSLVLDLGANARLWSEHETFIHTLDLTIVDSGETVSTGFGLRDFRAEGSHFTINGQRTFLRGKHDGLIFPLSGHAPTDLASWMAVMGQAKNHGINHYRFHTCCPPEAAFTAADRLGIYLEPELPFWGTVDALEEPGCDAAGQEYLIREGRRILDEFGNHPSFVMMSLGNELWGSKPRINEIIGLLKRHDSRPLFTQGSNNFQFVPELLPNEDFFCGVRFSRERLFRGSYAMCDAPQGHIQTAAPNACHSYDQVIRPGSAALQASAGGEITFQYGTGTKTVLAEAGQEFIPRVPVVSHEIGQYAMYPDYTEIAKYIGVLQARNLTIFRRRLEAAGMLDQADAFFRASGRFATECYKAELEAALRSAELAGFQLLDLQDFSGQGTALVGVLDAFMESKGVVSPAEWRQFCSDEVLLAEFGSFVVASGEIKTVAIKLARFRPGTLEKPVVRVSLSAPASAGEPAISLVRELPVGGSFAQGVFTLANLELDIPASNSPRRLELEISLAGGETRNRYQWWSYPRQIPALGAMGAPGAPATATGDWLETSSLDEVLDAAARGQTILYFPTGLDERNSIAGTYCTDFWCYPMFRSISQMWKRAVPIGTLGLLIDHGHPALAHFPSQAWSTPQWYDLVSASRALILDGSGIQPLVWNIDNFERHHRLGILFELAVGTGRVMVCTAPLPSLDSSLPARWLLHSLRAYLAGSSAQPNSHLEASAFRRFFEAG